MYIVSSTIDRLLLLLPLMLLSQIHTFAQSSSKNYLERKTYLSDDGSSFLRHIDYYDELGFVSETVDVGVNATQTPLVTWAEYGPQLKPVYQWAPVPSTSLDFLENVQDKAKSTYSSTMAYTTNEYDDFQQLSSSWKPGYDWDEHPTTITRNVVRGGIVRKYSVDASGNLVINDNSYYPYGLLMSCTTTDEDGHSMTVFTDFHEKTVLERRGSGDDVTDTYYVYDNYGRLAYVLPPMCQECATTSEMAKYWYRYKYDDRGRCTEKQFPGCDAIKYWYDGANRIVSEQDGHLRQQSLFRNYRYDGIGRLTLQTVSRTQGEASESGATIVEVKNYYDDYSCRQELSSLYSIWADSIFARQPLLTVARGKLTASLSTTSDGKKCFELFHYDAHGRISYKLSAYGDKWLKAVHTSYNFVGDVVSSLESVYTHVDFPKVLLARRTTRNTYHPGTRLLASTTVTHTDRNGATSTQTISNPTYDVFGNVTANNRPGTAADMTYDYDTLHGWLKGISSPSGFSQQLLRETAPNAQYSGSIGSMLWRNSNGGEQHGYDYTYDELGRLTHAQYSSFTKMVSGCYDESVTYNANGSITSLLRNGMRNDGTYGTIDDLTISYDGNRLRKVTDDAEAVNYNGALDFHDGADAEVEYEYDCNGALTKDGNRGITAITYDYGHHAKQISMTMNGVPQHIINDYSPDGRKLSSRHVLNTPTGRGGYHRLSTTDLYVDGLILRNNTPLLWQFEGGYVELDGNGTPTSWNYYVTDHLGSTRKVVDSNNNVKETINYYPFGSEMRIQEPGLLPQLADAGSHPFRFTGKELDRQNGLNMYDFGARQFDVAGVPMWTSVDPLAEKYYPFTPYAYCAGDPVNKFDPDGKVIVIEYKASDNNYYSLPFNGSGKYVYPKSQFVKDFFAAYNYNINNGGGKYMKKQQKILTIYIICVMQLIPTLSKHKKLDLILKKGNHI